MSIISKPIKRSIVPFAVIVAIGLGFPAISSANPAESVAVRPADLEDAGKPDQELSRWNPCKLTAGLSKKACLNDLTDDYFTSLGTCLNLGDREEIAVCVEEAGAARSEDIELCGARYEARRDFCEALGEYRYDPDFDPENFVSPAETAANPNPYFPLVPGYEWTYENEEEVIVVTVTDNTFEIEGVLCVEVRDIVFLKESGDLVEDTLDWYAQDLDGNVWYFGEISQNFEEGLLTSLDGSWRTGVDGAKPGVTMFADPYPGQVYRQEFLLREAEDGAEVISVAADESVEGWDCGGNCLLTFDFTPISPDDAEFKYYLPGVGFMLETKPGEDDRLELVRFTTGSED